MATIAEITAFCAETLEIDRFRDAALNGLQVAGATNLTRLATAVSVNRAVIEQAAGWGAEVLLVHHGMFWGDRFGPIVGPKRERLALLLGNQMNLLAYHLPLDAHPDVGNNAQLARTLGLTVSEPFAETQGAPIGWIARAPSPVPLSELVERVAAATARPPIVLGGGPEASDSVAILSGSGYSALEEASARGCGVLVTGDVRESTMAEARELGITVISGGHEATERLGVQALAEMIADRFGVETRFFHDPNPI